jgi:hypothetical protein
VLLKEAQKEKGFQTFDKCQNFFGAGTFGQRDVSTKVMKRLSASQVKVYLHVCFKSTILH